MPECEMQGCTKQASGNNKFCKKCYYSKIYKRRGGGRRNQGFFRMIVHDSCSDYGEKEVIARTNKPCGICGEGITKGSQIQFVTVCLECAGDKNNSSLIAMSESTFDDFCKICKKVIPRTASRPKTTKIEEASMPNESEITLAQMSKDLSRIMNGVVRIKRETLLKRLIDECGYSMIDASITVSSMLANESYIEDDGMILLRKQSF